MIDNNNFDVIIIGGSYSGLSAGMALGRSLRNVLIIDSGLPCNRQTPRSHNFLTQDGNTPDEISSLAKDQVEKYETVKFHYEKAIKGVKNKTGFTITTQSGRVFSAKRLIFATGIEDIMPSIEGFSECWGISVVHCPYCHGYEVKNKVTGILANGDAAMHYASLVTNLTPHLSVLANGEPSFTTEQSKILAKHEIKIIDTEIDRLEHNDGQLKNIVFKNGSVAPIKVLYAKVPFIQHSDIPENLGCELNDQGFIAVDGFQRTTVPGVFACGDNTGFMRSVANAVATGNLTGAMINKELCDEQF